MVQNEQQINVKKRDEYLFVIFPPYESPEQAQSQIAALYDAVDRHNASRLLIDCRATRHLIPIFELYELCLYLVSKLGLKNPRMAVIVSPEAVYPDRFGENVARNRGLDLIRFIDNEQAALDWLLERAPGLPRK